MTDPYAIRDFVVDRVRRNGTVLCHDVDTPVAQIHELFTVDGWDPRRYGRPELRVVDLQWTVERDPR